MQNTGILSHMTEDKLSETLKRLLFEKSLKPTELARLTQIPQPTIQRIIAGTTSRPHTNSLSPIANYFNISIQQLRGLEPIVWLKKTADESAGISYIPMLQWDEIHQWSEGKLNTEQHIKILTDAHVSKQSFAIDVVDSAMEPIFSVGTTLIIDATRKTKDRCYVIAYFVEQKKAVFRQLLTNAGSQYVRPLSPELEQLAVSRLNKNDQIVGVLVQAKHNFDTE